MDRKSKGSLIIIPTVIAEDTLQCIPSHSIESIHSTTHFVVERLRTARRFIKITQPPYSIESLNLIEIDNKLDSHITIVIDWLTNGHDVGVLSESGMPGIADPGSKVISAAHKAGFNVKPLVGPSSLFLSLAASGLNGQNFAFNGYLPIKDNLLKSTFKRLETLVLKSNQTQIFIETPYRNDRMFSFLIKNIQPNIKLCVAKDVTGQDEFIVTKTIKEWQSQGITIGKIPTIFLLGL